MDYLVQEIAGMPEPRPYLVLLGQTDGESNEIIKLAKQHLGVTNFQINTVSPTEVGYYYQVADAFVLASLREGFGRVFLEAMAYGLPCLAHDYEVTRFVLGDNAFLGDFQMPGRLAALIPQALSDSQNNDKRCQRHQSVYQRFSWDVLTPAYVQTIYQCISANNLIQPNANCP
jgi:glycosyltransferase involved in cell wall biosynthesis